MAVTVGFDPTTNDTFMVLEKVSSGPVTGTFLNLPEAGVLTVGPRQFRITYQGADGNDVVLRRIDPPALLVGSIAAGSSGHMLIGGQGVPFATYVLDASSSLDAPGCRSRPTRPTRWVDTSSLTLTPTAARRSIRCAFTVCERRKAHTPDAQPG